MLQLLWRVVLAFAFISKSSAYIRNCEGDNICEAVTIDCPANEECIVTCSGYKGCWETKIDGTLSSSLSVTCSGGGSSAACARVNIYCPPNIQGTKRCTVTADDALQDTFKLYAINSWNDINIIYSGTFFLPIFGWGDMFCTADYSAMCLISTTDIQTCDDPGHECNNPPAPTSPNTPYPTTDIPTTAMPTMTADPTTSDPTTNAPTTAPTTSAPTTAYPTTNAPTTLYPTTSGPTTAYPSTSYPTTATPTASDPTTTYPTTATPTASESDPTTISPTTLTTTSFPSTAIPFIPSTVGEPTFSPTKERESGVAESTEMTGNNNNNTDSMSKLSQNNDYLWILYVIIGTVFCVLTIVIVLWIKINRKRRNKSNEMSDNIVKQNVINVLSSSPDSMSDCNCKMSEIELGTTIMTMGKLDIGLGTSLGTRTGTGTGTLINDDNGGEDEGMYTVPSSHHITPMGISMNNGDESDDDGLYTSPTNDDEYHETPMTPKGTKC